MYIYIFWINNRRYIRQGGGSLVLLPYHLWVVGQALRHKEQEKVVILAATPAMKI